MPYQTLILANFGGPRNLEEVEPFLIELLNDTDVIWPKLPLFFHRWLFTRIAKKRALRVKEDYKRMGGKSPIYEDTENLAKALSQKLQISVICFHRYLKATHPLFLKRVEEEVKSPTLVLPLFPQYSYATTGSLARFFKKNLLKETVNNLRWIRSFAGYKGFIASYVKKIKETLDKNQLLEEEVALLFSSHGVPENFILKKDTYQQECQISYQEVAKAFPKASCLLSFQSRFGPEEWLKPYTEEVCQNLPPAFWDKKAVMVIPLSFISDHIETLYEIEDLYLPLIRKQGKIALRCPALNLDAEWIEGLLQLIQTTDKGYATEDLIRS